MRSERFVSYEAAIELLRERALLRRKAALPVELFSPKGLPRGLICAEDVESSELIPRFRNSAMDGFAVRAADLRSASPGTPIELLVIGEVAAGDHGRCDDSCGHSDDSDRHGTACEIMTGATVPDGYDSIVRVEDTELRCGPNGSVRVLVRAPVKMGEFIREIGEDFSIGTTVIARGTPIRPEHVLAAAALGVTHVMAVPRPRIAIISTGRELVPATSRELAPGQIRNSTLPYLVNAIPEMGGEVVWSQTVRDEESTIAEAFCVARNHDPDVIVTTGAVSMGRYDFVKAVLERLEAMIIFHKVSMRPGKPVLFAELPGLNGVAHGPVVVGLPGNPISTAVGLRFFVEPLLRSLTGMPLEKPILAHLANPTEKPEGLRCFFKARWRMINGEAAVSILPGQASFMVRPLLEANCWAVLPESGEILDVGTPVQVYPLYPARDEIAQRHHRDDAGCRKGACC